MGVWSEKVDENLVPAEWSSEETRFLRIGRSAKVALLAFHLYWTAPEGAGHRARSAPGQG